LKGESFETQPYLSESALARLHIIVRGDTAAAGRVDFEAVEARLADAVRSWQDELRDALVDRFGEERGLELTRRYAAAFPPAYVDDVTPKAAAFDVERLKRLAEGLVLPQSL